MHRLALIILLGITLPAFAQAEFYIEQSNGLVSIPAAARRAILNSLGAEANDCTPTAKPLDRCALSGFAVVLDAGNHPKGYLVVPQDDSIWAASAAPIWIVAQRHGKYRILLHQVTYDIKILNSVTHQMHDIKTERGTASMMEWELWKYDGDKYAIAKKYAGAPE